MKELKLSSAFEFSLVTCPIPAFKDPRCSFERLMIFLQNITQMMLNNPNINNQFKCHPKMDVLLKYGKIEQCPESQYTTVRAPGGRAKFQSNILTKRTKSRTMIYHFIRLIFLNSLVQSISALALLKWEKFSLGYNIWK